jgi:thiol peroxidase
MSDVTFKGNPITVSGTFPEPGDKAPAFQLVAGDLSDTTLAGFGDATKVLNIFPSVDTGVCAASARAVVVLDGDNNVVYSELVPEITQEPDYEGALSALK